MREQIQRFMQDCLKAKTQAFANNPYSIFVRSDIPEALYATGLVDREKYLITASAGVGNWAMIPWICILDREVTTTTSKGIYITYLLSKDSKRLYLTLNQGSTEICNKHTRQEAIRILHMRANEIRNIVSAHGFAADGDIDLGNDLTIVGEMYREGTIFYKQYDINDIPEEIGLQYDLSRMMQVYAEYIQKCLMKQMKVNLIEKNRLAKMNQGTDGHGKELSDKKTDVFIICESRDKPVADAICAHLKSKGIKGLYATEKADDNTDLSFEYKMIDAVKACVVVVSEYGINSDRVAKEARYARNTHKLLVPFLMVKEELPTELRFALSGIQYIQAAGFSLEKCIEQLGSVVEKLMDVKELDLTYLKGYGKKIVKPVPYQGNQPYIFISYAHKDKEIVYPIISHLIEKGLRIWFDVAIYPGKEWDEVIASHVESCDAMIAFITANYLASDNCRDELNYSRDLKKDRLLIYLEDVKLRGGMAMRMNRIQAIHLSAFDSIEEFYDKILQCEFVNRNRDENSQTDR